jgi:ribose 5-phosphate isomerase B
MRIAVGSDHAGYLLEEFLVAHVAELGHDVDDLGTHSDESADYPEVGAAVGRAVVKGRAQLGLATRGTGMGTAIAANKVAGVRAAVVHDVTTARLARAHNHANVLCMGAACSGTKSPRTPSRPSSPPPALGGPHGRRVDEISVLEAG